MRSQIYRQLLWMVLNAIIFGLVLAISFGIVGWICEVVIALIIWAGGLAASFKVGSWGFIIGASLGGVVGTFFGGIKGWDEGYVWVKPTTILCGLFGHRLGEWEYEAKNSCQQVRFCVRDDFRESREAHHQFGEWEFIAPNSCEQSRVCKRDGFEERRQLPHQFGQWVYLDTNTRKLVCQRCSLEHKEIKETCQECGGRGQALVSHEETYQDSCGQCGGGGNVESYTQGLVECSACGGSGSVTNSRSVTNLETCPSCRGLKDVWSSAH